LLFFNESDIIEETEDEQGVAQGSSKRAGAGESPAAGGATVEL